MLVAVQPDMEALGIQVTQECAIDDRAGNWSLSPAFDVVYSFNPSGRWTGRHQMSLNGQRERFEVADFVACVRSASLKRGRAKAILDQVRDAVRNWPTFAAQAGVSTRRVRPHRTPTMYC